MKTQETKGTLSRIIAVKKEQRERRKKSGRPNAITIYQPWFSTLGSFVSMSMGVVELSAGGG